MEVSKIVITRNNVFIIFMLNVIPNSKNEFSSPTIMNLVIYGMEDWDM